MSDPMPLAMIPRAGFVYQVVGENGDCKIRGGARFSGDGANWSPATELYASYATDPATPITAGDVDLSGLGESPRTLIQFGMLVGTATDDTQAFCQAILRVEPHVN